MQDDGVTLPGGQPLPDPRPAFVPVGFDPFPDHALRGVSQPLGPGVQTELRLRQYVRGLVGGYQDRRPMKRRSLQDAPRLRVQVCAWSDRETRFEAASRVAEASEVDGSPSLYSRDATYQVLYVHRGEWFLQVRAPRDLARDEVFRVAASVALHQEP
jgi:sarcosine oxidase gamma subunit